LNNQQRQEIENCRKVTLKIISEIEARILGKRGPASETWIQLQDPWELSPMGIRDKTLVEIADLVKEYRVSIKKEMP